MTIKNIRNQTKLSQKDFSKKYNIPLKTLQNWESYENNPTGSQSRKPTEWTVNLLKRVVDIDYPQEGDLWVKK